MAVAIDVTFFNAIQKLSNEDRERILTFVGKFQENPALPGHSLERVQQARSDNIWSARVSQELRAIAVKDGEDWALVYVDHHDEAYRWTENRSIERHGRTGALQIVVPSATASAPAALSKPRGIFDHFTEDYLFSLGVPEIWLPTIRQITNDDELIEVA